jgi:hypothetical protein
LERQLASAETKAADRSLRLEARAEWKRRLREQLLSADYRWPEDSPFVRVPKAALENIGIYTASSPPGVLTLPMREMLGLTPAERGSIEADLHEYYSTLHQTVESRIREVDEFPPRSSSSFGMPKDTVAKKMWVIPKLDDVMDAQAEKLRSSVEVTLGPERGNSRRAESLVYSRGFTDTQQVAVWVERVNGNLLAFYGYAGLGSSFTQGGINLELFHPDTRERLGLSGGTDIDRLIESGKLIDSWRIPEPAAQWILAWIQQQAASHFSKENNR